VRGEFLLVFGQSAEVTLDLNTMPELRGLAEKCSETDGHSGRDGTAGVDDLVDRTGRDADGAGHGILGNPHGNQVFLQKDFAWCDEWAHGYNVSRYTGVSMVITNFDIDRAMFIPSENDSPLVVDADRVVTHQISFQGFKAVSGRNRKILKHPSPVHLDQFAQCHPGDCTESSTGFTLKELLGIIVSERLNHAGENLSNPDSAKQAHIMYEQSPGTFTPHPSDLNVRGGFLRDIGQGVSGAH